MTAPHPAPLLIAGPAGSFGAATAATLLGIAVADTIGSGR